MSTYKQRPSRSYVNGIGKPVVAKRWDKILKCYEWVVVFPPRNNLGEWIVAPEAKLCHKAEAWCDKMNLRAFDLRRTK